MKANPAVGTSVADLKAQFDFLEKVRDGLSQAHATVLKIRDAKAQIKSIDEHARKTGKGDAIGPKAKALTEKLTAIEEKLINPQIKANEDDLNFLPKIDHEFTNLAGEVGSADAKPTASQQAYYLVLKKQLDAVLVEFQQAVDRDLADFHAAVEVLKSFGGVVVVDPKEPALM